MCCGLQAEACWLLGILLTKCESDAWGSLLPVVPDSSSSHMMQGRSLSQECTAPPHVQLALPPRASLKGCHQPCIAPQDDTLPLAHSSSPLACAHLQSADRRRRWGRRAPLLLCTIGVGWVEGGCRGTNARVRADDVALLQCSCCLQCSRVLHRCGTLKCLPAQPPAASCKG